MHVRSYFISSLASHSSVNACLLPVCQLHGVAVMTVEGIGSTKTKLHPVQVSDSHYNLYLPNPDYEIQIRKLVCRQIIIQVNILDYCQFKYLF